MARYDNLLECCRTKGKKAYLTLQGFLIFLALTLGSLLTYLITVWDSLLVGYFFLFSFPALLLCFVLLLTIFLGCRGVKRKRKPLLVVSIIIVTLLVIASIISAIALLILAGYFTSFPLLGDYFTDLSEQFKIQVFNDCCVGVDSNFTVNACGEPTLQPICFDGSNEWSDLVSEDLCTELIRLESDTKVGNETGSCGGGNAEVFLEDFTPFLEDNMNYAALGIMVFTIVLILGWVLGLFQCCALDPVARSTPVSYGGDDDDDDYGNIPNFGGPGKGGLFLQTDLSGQNNDSGIRSPPPPPPF
mmetsp:Transcript_3631/g.4350  ORF Transcript_3631/g.4350 Transcript_3631/m.4350 type:complete len:302 (-) Transcript_3631:613-1518(-)|eukprot:CAMPEP_0184019806 /NCGR_PEP_ID=MMETSP0954-20121128/8970_1 /TAXON_ID=627963 /ORGANISM="Aplanochytrium sp, Strain PBS07" /LENGTH=301 /DNA_ID=CAMNT_0026301541 /DNA_START=127 /DNA_END=1032 /DNA_ORIENTATION=-